MVIKKVTISVDKKFFNNQYEKERQKMQKKLGLVNLTQVNFSKMIEGFKLREPPQDLSQVNTRFKKRRRRC